jgi:UBX domain-containing protein 7
MDSAPEGRTYTERYQVHDYPHIGIVDPRTGRLLWRKEGWTQQNPMTAETFAEIAMDFCSRNSFDRPPQAPRPLGAAAAATTAESRPAKRPMNEMSEAEQLQAAMRASMAEVSADGVDDDGDAEIQYLDDSDDDDEVQVVDSKPVAEEKQPTLNDELLSFAVSDEPTDGSRLQLRMPDGKRVIRKFAASDLVRAIYAFIVVSSIKCHLVCSYHGWDNAAHLCHPSFLSCYSKPTTRLAAVGSLFSW